MKTDGRTVLGLLLFRTACIDNDKAVCREICVGVAGMHTRLND